MIIPDFLDNSCKKYPEKPAIIFKDKEYSYKYISDHAQKITNYITSISKPNDIVSLFMPNSVDFVIAYFGILKSGRTCHIISSTISDESIKYQVDKTRPSIIISNSNYEKKILRTRIEESRIFLNMDSIPEKSKNKDVKIKDSCVASIMFSSGTTYLPKAIQISHKNIVDTTHRIVNYLQITSEDVDVNSLSLSHLFGLGCLHCNIMQGTTTVLHRNSINLKEVLNSMQKYSATTFANVPAIFQLLLDNYKELFKESVSTLRYALTNSAPMPNKLVKEVLSILEGKKLYTYYGLTEASRCTFHLYNENLSKINSVGMPLPGIEIWIKADNKSCKPLENGEIFVKGTNVTSGYFKNKSMNTKIKNGWLQTGDIGHLDEQGYLYIIGRVDDMINIAGEKVSPLEIEKVLNKMEGIKESVVKGVSDRILGNIPKAFIVTKEENTITDKDIIKFCKKELESYKIPKIFIFIDKIPKNEQGKIQRKLI